MKPHLKFTRGLWYCSMKFRRGFGMGYTPAMAYESWARLMRAPEDWGACGNVGGRSMTQDDIISMAREAGAVEEMIAMGRSDGVLFSASELFRFAALVAAAEREACAKVCDQKTDHEEAARAKKSVADACAEKDQKRELSALRHELTVSTFNAGIAACAKAIRARGSNV